MGKDSPSPPPPPDYIGAARATGESNLEAVRAQTAANRINQYSPYGSLEYSQTPGAKNPDSGWTSTTKLAPAQQQLLDQQNKTSLGLSALADRGVGYVNDALSNQITAGSLPGVTQKVSTNPYNDAYNQIMSRYKPEIDQSHKALETQLANQGIMPGTEAYKNALRVQNQSENDLRTQASLSSIDVGNKQQNQQMQVRNQQMDYQNQQLGLQTALQNNPINVLNAVRSGSQVTNPSFGAVPQQQNAGGVDYSGAAKGNNDYNLGLYNSQVAANNAASSSMYGLAGAGLTAGALFF